MKPSFILKYAGETYCFFVDDGHSFYYNINNRLDCVSVFIHNDKIYGSPNFLNDDLLIDELQDAYKDYIADKILLE